MVKLVTDDVVGSLGFPGKRGLGLRRHPFLNYCLFGKAVSGACLEVPGETNSRIFFPGKGIIVVRGGGQGIILGKRLTIDMAGEARVFQLEGVVEIRKHLGRSRLRGLYYGLGHSMSRRVAEGAYGVAAVRGACYGLGRGSSVFIDILSRAQRKG